MMDQSRAHRDRALARGRHHLLFRRSIPTTNFEEVWDIVRVVKCSGLAWNLLGPSLNWPAITFIELKGGYKPGQKYRYIEP